MVRCLGYQFNVDYRVTMLIVLWALGWAMIVAGGAGAPAGRGDHGFGLVLIAGHNLFDGVRSATALAGHILHAPGVRAQWPDMSVFVAYPLIPWVGVTAVGYGLGQIYAWPAERRRAFLLRAWAAADRRVRRAARHQRLRRSVALDDSRASSITRCCRSSTRPSTRRRCCSC